MENDFSVNVDNVVRQDGVEPPKQAAATAIVF